MLQRKTRQVDVGGVPLGGGAPVSVQTMLADDPHDLKAISAHLTSCAEAGADIVCAAVSTAVTMEMNESGRKLSENYANFVDDISRGFSVSMKLFEENMNRILQAMHEKLAAVENIHGNANAKAEFVREAEGCAAALSRLQVAIRDMTDALNVPEEK